MILSGFFFGACAWVVSLPMSSRSDAIVNNNKSHPCHVSLATLNCYSGEKRCNVHLFVALKSCRVDRRRVNFVISCEPMWYHRNNRRWSWKLAAAFKCWLFVRMVSEAYWSLQNVGWCPPTVAAYLESCTYCVQKCRPDRFCAYACNLELHLMEPKFG
jgi:hypothetical protein